MLKSNALKIAALQNIASAQNNNASATRGLAREQSKTNELLQEQLEVKDRVDISMREYQDLKHIESCFHAYRDIFSNILAKTDLNPEELATAMKKEVLVSFDENPVDLSMRLHIALNLDIPIFRMRELLEKNRL